MPHGFVHQARRRIHPATTPGLVGVACLAGVVYVGLVDPNQPGHYPMCPFLYFTGCYCPGCGTLRAVHALVHGHLGEALGFNPLTVIMMPVLACGWLRWLSRAARGRTDGQYVHPALLYGWVVLILVFWVVRNLPFGHALAP